MVLKSLTSALLAPSRRLEPDWFLLCVHLQLRVRRKGFSYEPSNQFRSQVLPERGSTRWEKLELSPVGEPWALSSPEVGVIIGVDEYFGSDTSLGRPFGMGFMQQDLRRTGLGSCVDP
ncbi:Cardiomyopathy-Associated Protein 5 [Manis pentadactyla]|nr:Cardiomyopathy-Associated Protein 5 [Manis pentadactyla]